MTEATFTLRPPQPGDALELARLMVLLGHPVEPWDLQRRLSALDRLDPEGLRLVAVEGGRAIGYVAAHLTPMLHRERPVGRVTTLVVGSERQGSGVGSRLLAAAEEWLAARGAIRCELTTGDLRLDAHRFYERRGWRREGVRYVREREP